MNATATGIAKRIEIKNILFLTDFSPAAIAACPYAAELAKRFGANLYALHVRPPIVNPMTPPISWPTIEEAADEVLETQKENLLNSFPGVVSEVIIEEGDLWDNLLFAVEKKKIDLIVMGTRGRSGVGKFFMGSVSEEIFRKSPCAVVTVGPFSPAEPARAGVIAEILFATNFSPESLAAAPYALSLAQEYQARLTLLHVIEAPKTGEFVIPQELLESSLRRLRDIVPPEVELWCKPRFLVEEGPAAEKILDVARRKKADLIVLGVHEPSGFPGAVTHLPLATAHKVVSHAPCPVLTARH